MYTIVVLRVIFTYISDTGTAIARYPGSSECVGE